MCRGIDIKMQARGQENPQATQPQRENSTGVSGKSSSPQGLPSKFRKLNSMYKLELDKHGSTVFSLADASPLHETSDQPTPELIYFEVSSTNDMLTRKLQGTKSDSQTEATPGAIFESRIENIQARLASCDYSSHHEKLQLEHSLARFERAKQKRENCLRGFKMNH
mmetsp:Transcript_10199/g.17505  ORF Transcript_10199/g.17505 Transcript_10199/m.17505 type:complete len:166 (+) Transcript_10199:74-571(+)